MMRGLAIVGGGILVVVAMLALAGAGGIAGPVRVAVMAVAIAGVAFLFWWDNRREKKEKVRASADIEKRFAELSSQAERPQFELAVTGSSQLLLSAAFTLIGGGTLFAGISMQHLWLFLGGLVLLGPALLLLLRVVPMIGKPLIVMNRSGFKTPLSSHLSWKAIDGIYLQKIVIRENVIHQLIFRIGTLPQLIQEFGLFHRVLYPLSSKAKKERFWFDLKGSNENPEAVYRIMRLLWTKSTGRKYDWDPNISAEANAALRKMDETNQRLQKDLNAGLITPPSPEDFARSLKAMKEMDANFAVVEKELKGKMRWAKWVQYLAIASLIFYVFIRLYGKLR